MEQEKGKLYIVATPIGNSRDMSPRGCDILRSVDIIAAEDTRRSMVLLNKLEIRNKLVSNHKYNEHAKARHFVNEILEGKSIAVITDAGTPCISDPGNELIRAAVEAGIEVVGIPGCCAAVTALSISGFDLSSFLFCGFFPREAAERKKTLDRLRQGSVRTCVFYESPLRIMNMMEFLVEIDAGMNLCVCNDMTKLHEACFRGRPAEIIVQLKDKGSFDKGEYVVVIELDESYLFQKVEHTVSAEAMLADVMVSKGLSGRDAVSAVLGDENNSYSKNELKSALLNLKKLVGS